MVGYRKGDCRFDVNRFTWVLTLDLPIDPTAVAYLSMINRKLLHAMYVQLIRLQLNIPITEQVMNLLQCNR